MRGIPGSKYSGLILVVFFLGMLVISSAEGLAYPEEKAQESVSDQGKQPWVFDIEKLTMGNTDFRMTAWTGSLMQLTLMSIPAGGEIGLEMHPDIDQFIRVESGKARVLMGKSKDDLSFVKEAEGDWAVLIPAGYWHNLVNIGESDLKLYSLYAPPEHKHGTRHQTADDAEKDHHHHH